MDSCASLPHIPYVGLTVGLLVCDVCPSKVLRRALDLLVQALARQAQEKAREHEALEAAVEKKLAEKSMLAQQLKRKIEQMVPAGC